MNPEAIRNHRDQRNRNLLARVAEPVRVFDPYEPHPKYYAEIPGRWMHLTEEGRKRAQEFRKTLILAHDNLDMDAVGGDAFMLCGLIAAALGHLDDESMPDGEIAAAAHRYLEEALAKAVPGEVFEGDSRGPGAEVALAFPKGPFKA